MEILVRLVTTMVHGDQNVSEVSHYYWLSVTGYTNMQQDRTPKTILFSRNGIGSHFILPPTRIITITTTVSYCMCSTNLRSNENRGLLSTPLSKKLIAISWKNKSFLPVLCAKERICNGGWKQEVLPGYRCDHKLMKAFLACCSSYSHTTCRGDVSYH